MSPSLYLSLALRNKGIRDRICSLSMEQAMYFSPYQEGFIPSDVVRALRRGDVDRLKQCSVDELAQRNQFGESLAHLACRFGLRILKFLIEDAKLEINVRDKFGRSPLHNACLSGVKNFENVAILLKHAPNLVLFEDNKGKVPFDYIPKRNHGKWSRFLSEQKVLAQLQCKLLMTKMFCLKNHSIETTSSNGSLKIPCQKVVDLRLTNHSNTTQANDNTLRRLQTSPRIQILEADDDILTSPRRRDLFPMGTEKCPELTKQQKITHSLFDISDCKLDDTPGPILPCRQLHDLRIGNATTQQDGNATPTKCPYQLHHRDTFHSDSTTIPRRASLIVNDVRIEATES